MTGATLGRSGEAEDSVEKLPASTLALARGVFEGVAVCRAQRIDWASPRLAEIVGANSPSSLEGRAPESLFEKAPVWGDGQCAVGQLASGGEVRIRRLVAGDPSEEIWVVSPSSEEPLLRKELAATRRQAAEFQCEAAALGARLQRELDEREELLTIVSHELRTPVTVISGYNRLLLSDQVGTLSSEQRRFLEESSRSCQRLDRFIANLLKSSRVGAGEEPLDLRSLSLRPVVEGVVKFLQPLLDEHELEVEVAMHPDAPECRFDSSRIEQVVTNLLGNAIKYTRPGSAVVVKSRALECEGRAFVEVSVLDEGPGIALEDRDRIFDPYVRANEERRASGLGLGLAICRRIIEAHGGAIGVSDREGGGSRFHFTLPAEPSAEWSAQR